MSNKSYEKKHTIWNNMICKQWIIRFTFKSQKKNYNMTSE